MNIITDNSSANSEAMENFGIGEDENVVETELCEMSSSDVDEEEEDPMKGRSYSDNLRISNVTGYDLSTNIYLDRGQVNGTPSSLQNSDRDFPMSSHPQQCKPSKGQSMLFHGLNQSNANIVDEDLVWKPSMSLLELAYKLKKAELRVFGRQSIHTPSGHDIYRQNYERQMEMEDNDSINGEIRSEYHSQILGEASIEREGDRGYNSYRKNLNNFDDVPLGMNLIQNVKSEMIDQSFEDGSDFDQSYNRSSSLEPMSSSLFERSEYIMRRKHQCQLCPYSTDRLAHLKRHELAIHAQGGRKLKYFINPISQNLPKTTTHPMSSPVHELFSTPTTKATVSSSSGIKAAKISVSATSVASKTMEGKVGAATDTPANIKIVEAIETSIMKDMTGSREISSVTRTPSIIQIPGSIFSEVQKVRPTLPKKATNVTADVAKTPSIVKTTSEIFATASNSQAAKGAADYRKHACTMCSYKTDCNSHLKRHVASVHNAEKVFRCKFCPDNLDFARSDKLKKHYAVHHPGIPCNLHDLRIVKKPEKPVPPPSTFQTRTTVLPPPSNKRPGDADFFSAPFDDATADAEVAELVSISSANKVKGPKPFRCPKCTYAAKDVWHMRRHIGDKHVRCRNYKCRVCRYVTGRIDRLMAHQRNHGEMFCLYCESYSTAHIDSYKRHMVSCSTASTGHTWEGSSDPFNGINSSKESLEQERTCRLCNVVYDHVTELEKHIDSAHIIVISNAAESGEASTGGLMCGTCGYQVNDSADMYIHVNSHAPQSFKCASPDCNFKSTYAKTLELHRKYYHDVSYENSPFSRYNKNKLTDAAAAAAVVAAFSGFNADGSVQQTDDSFHSESQDYTNEKNSFSEGFDASAGYYSGGVTSKGREHVGGKQSKKVGLSSHANSTPVIESVASTAMHVANAVAASMNAGCSPNAGIYSGADISKGKSNAGFYGADIAIEKAKRDEAPLNCKPTTTSTFAQASLAQSFNINPSDIQASGIFNCPICVDRAPFKYRKSFEKHLTQHAASLNLCPLCTETFHSTTELQQHVMVVHGNVQYSSSFMENMSKSQSKY